MRIILRIQTEELQCEKTNVILKCCFGMTQADIKEIHPTEQQILEEYKWPVMLYLINLIKKYQKNIKCCLM